MALQVMASVLMHKSMVLCLFDSWDLRALAISRQRGKNSGKKEEWHLEYLFCLAIATEPLTCGSAAWISARALSTG